MTDSDTEAVRQHSREAESFTAGYDQLGQDPYASCFAYSRRRLDLLLARLLPAQPARADLLDVGCGTGHHLKALRARGYDAVGVDGSGAMLREARGLDGAAPLAQSDVTALPFRSASFDAALSVEVHRYLPDALPLLREIARVLRPGGTCLVTAVPWLSLNGYPLVNRLLPSRPGFSPLRQYFTGVGALRAQLVAAGLVPVDVHAVYWGPLNWVERLAPERLSGFLRGWEATDARVSASSWGRSTANMLLAVARRPEAGA
ncbi:MAG: class I SAM-dependent methyltransferase [Vicinamibacteria bacterium]